MANGASQATNYTPHETLSNRLRQAKARGDKFAGKISEIRVPFHPSFDRFAANVAYAIRHEVVYRSDGGRFARGLVRGSGNLEKIHGFYAATDTPSGMQIRLRAKLWRRQDPKAANRWAMNIHFRAPDWRVEEGEEIVADEKYVRGSQQRALEAFIERATFLGQDIPGERGKRIRKFVELLDRLSFPKNMNLWYYGDEYVRIYLDWRTDDKTRQLMTRQTSGKMPFDGRANTSGITGAWRRYPFRDVIKFYSESWSDSQVKGKLAGIDKAIFLSYSAAQKVIATSSLGGGKLHGPLASAFLKHLSNLQKDKSHLYSVYT